MVVSSRTMLALAAVAAVIASAGCSRSASRSAADATGGSAKVVAALAPGQNATSIARVTLTVGPGTGTAFTPIVVQLANQDLVGKLAWSALVADIPAGTGRTFHIDAFDGATPANVLYTGDATATIVAGASANVYLLLQETSPGGGPTSRVPVVDWLTASAGRVPAAGSVSLSIGAHAPDPGVTVAFQWGASCGSLTPTTGTAPTWTAPAVVPPSGSCQVSVTVTSSTGQSVTAGLGIEVYVVPAVVAVTPAAGGTVTSTTGLTIAAPPNAVATPVTITVTQVVGAPPPEAANAVSPVYEFGPAGTQFVQPITISFPLPAGVTSPTVYYSNPNGVGYSDIGGTIVGNLIVAQVTHFSSGFVGGKNFCAQNPGATCQTTSSCRAAACQATGACLEVANVADGSTCSTGDACRQGETCTAGACGGGYPVCTAVGSVQALAYANSWPIISGVVARETYTKGTNGQLVSMDVDLTASASDPDGDDLTYVWTSDCTAAGTGFTSAAQATPVATLSTGPGQLATNAVHFRSTDLTKGCTLRVDVRDSWVNGIVPVGSGLPVARGGQTTGQVYASVPVDFVLAPQITNVTSPNVGNKVQASQVFVVGIQVVDPTPAFNAAQVPFGYAWTFTGGVTLVPASEIDVTTSPGSSVVQVSIPNPLQTGMSATVVVTNRSGLRATYTWNFVPQNPCDGTAGSVGLACDTGLGLCAGNATGAGTCTAAGTCVSAAAVTCTALDQCHDVGVCNPATGTCSNPVKAVGTACSDGTGCTTGDVCNAAGACVGAAVVCTQTANTCQAATGTCTSTGATTYTCGFANLAANTACNDGNACTQTDLCDGAGTCLGSNPVSCTGGACSTGGTCNPATGACVGGTVVPNGTACNDGNACTTGDVCTNGVCAGTAACAAGQSCTPATGACVDTVVVPQQAKDLPLGNFQGLALAEDGSAFVTGVLALPAKTFDGTTLTSAGAGDVFVGRYPAGGGVATWVRNFGDASDQQPTGIAVTLDGTVVALGQFTGALGTVNNANATPVDYLLGINGTTGAISWSRAINNGVSGVLTAVAANPALNQFAVCGYASAASDMVTGAVYGGGTQDIVIGMFSSTGTLLWSRQIGGANEEACDALAIDDNGDLYAAGRYDGALTFTGTALPSPASSFRRWIWVAKFNGTNGTALAQASFGAGAGNHKPQALAVDATGQLVMSGLMSNTLAFGATSLVSAGGTDAFVAKLNPAAATPFAPTWAVRIGGTAADEARGVAVDSFGNVVAVGLFNGTTTGAAVLTAGTATASSAFVLKLNGATGAVVANGAAAYGNATNTVNANKVAVNRQGIGAVQNQVVLGGEYAGALNFGTAAAPISINSTNASDFLVFGRLQ